MQQLALVVDAIVHEQLVECSILHHAGDVGVAAMGEVVARLPLITAADALVRLLRVEVRNWQCARAVQRVDGVLGQVDGVHGVGGVPIIDQLVEAEFLEQRFVERKVARRRVVVARLLNGAAL